MPINDAYSRWSTENGECATSASHVIEVAGSNHAIRVILNLAWGPNNYTLLFVKAFYNNRIRDQSNLALW